MKRVIAIVLCVMIVLSTLAILFSALAHGADAQIVYDTATSSYPNFTGIIFFILMVFTGAVGFAMFAFKRTKSITKQ